MKSDEGTERMTANANVTKVLVFSSSIHKGSVNVQEQVWCSKLCHLLHCPFFFKCFWATLIWILSSSSKNSEKNPDFYFFVTSLYLFIVEE
jgi:hypothetical protein